MGAANFVTTATGRDAREAFSSAVREAQYEYGHGGYTGTIAEKGSDGFVLLALPPRTTVAKIVDLLEEYDGLVAEVEWARETGRQKSAERSLASFRRRNERLLPFLDRANPTYQDKWGPAVAVELKGSAAAKVKERRGLKGTRQRVFVFFGYASS